MGETIQKGKAQILDGTATSNAIKEELQKEVSQLTSKGGRAPGLAVILVGDDPASHIYVKNKIAACKKVGIISFLHQFPADAKAEEIFAKVSELNNAEDVDGILIQLPLPKGLPTENILLAVDPAKDADGLHALNVGLLVTGKPAPRPCTPQGIMALIDRYEIPLKGKNAVVIGRSNLVGKPIALMLLERHATVTICHSRTENLAAVAKTADVLVVAAGQAQMVKGSWIKPGAVVIDVGIHRQTLDNGENKLVGDVDFNEASSQASMITPVPGGIGPMTIAMLLSNTVAAFKLKVARNQSPAVLQ
jgi:methylenetetrahydrofolate dehydrogenase (NADP+)/methenyltetrahydrofolate cyclohydrolase